MSRARTHALLAAVIVAELVAGGLLVADRWVRVAPPAPDLSHVDPITAAELRRLSADCRTPDQWAKLGETYLALGFFPEAEACYRRAAALDPANPDLAFRHAFALERIGRIDEANEQYRSAAARNHPRAADCWYHVGRNHLRLEQSGPAAEAFARAGPLPAARYELAVLNARAGRVAEADAEAARLAAEFPSAYPPASLRYRLAVGRGDPAAAAFADQFARRPRPLPTPFDAEVERVFGVANGTGRGGLFQAAGREAQAGRFAAAEAKLREALDARWEPEIADRLAEVVFVLRRPDEAERILAEAVERGGPSFELLWRLGQARDALGRRDEALALWERAARLASGPRARDLWSDLAARYEQAGRGNDAKRYLARARHAAGAEALDAGRPEEAAAFLSRATEADPQFAQAWFALGEAHRVAGRAAEARAAYDRCLRLDADHGRARRSLELLGQ